MGKKVKVLKRWSITIIWSVILLFNVLTIQNEAVNKTNQISKNITNTTNQKNNQISNQTTDASNAELMNLGITPHDFTGFTPTTTWYEVEVPENTKTIEVYAKAQVAKAKVSGTGKKNLEKGKNNIEVVVTAPNGNKKTYTICVIRGENKDQSENTSAKNEGLSELKINHLNLTPEFETNVYEYTVKYVGEESKLNIETKTTKEDYIVEITGNENLQEGENIVTILVSKSNGDNIATYQITINKKLIDEEAIQKEAIQRKQKQKIIIAVVGAIIIIVIVCIIISYQKKRKREIELSRAYFYGSDEEENEEELEEEIDEEEKIENIEIQEEIPKALKQKQQQEQQKVQQEEEEQQEKEEPPKKQEKEKEEEEVEKMSKEEIKEIYLNNYSNPEDKNDLEKHKGKRFK